MTILDTLLASPPAGLPWLPMSWWEIIATVFGLWSVWAYVRENAWAWPSGLVNVLMFIIMFWHCGLYAETGLQVVFTVLQLWGWWMWLRGGKAHAGVAISRTSSRQWLWLGAMAVVLYVPLALLLKYQTDSTVPWWDSLPTALSLVAQGMISYKKIENWWVWIAVDVISVPLFAYKELYLIAGLYVVFLGLCVAGHRHWKRLLAQQAVSP